MVQGFFSYIKKEKDYMYIYIMVVSRIIIFKPGIQRATMQRGHARERTRSEKDVKEDRKLEVGQ